VQVASTAEQLLFTTLRLETTLLAGGTGVGTAFLFALPTSEGVVQAIVTNKHVVDGAGSATLTFTLATPENQPDLQRRFQLKIPRVDGLFVGHTDPDVDIAAAPFAPLLHELTSRNASPFLRQISEDLMPTPEQEQSLDAIDDILFVGYPNGIWDSTNNLPIVRRGTTATPVTVDFMGRPQFLIDASVFPGSSGSPVFLYNTGMYSQKGGETVVGNRLFFLGLVSSVFYRRAEGEIEVRPAPTVGNQVAVTQEMIDLGVVVKARVVSETVRTMIATYTQGTRA
jgi:Trypsin-like peptidase domain